MKLQEIEEGSSISITVKREDTSATFPSEVYKVFTDCILVNLFVFEDNVISFEGENLTIEMVVVKPGEVPYFFKNIKITREIYMDQPYHCIRTGTVGVRLNRRNAFRAFIGEEGSALEVPGNRRVDVLVKDLSSTGIGFLINKNEKTRFETGQHLEVIFKDSLISSTIDVVARVVRIEEKETDILYGCAFSKHYPQIDRYVAAKQTRKGINQKKPRPEK